MTDTNVRSYLLDELGDADAPIGSRSWCLYTANEIRKMLYDKQQLGARLHNYVSAFQERQGWQELGFLTWEDFCVKRLQVRADEVETEARARIAAIAEKAIPLTVNGGDRKTVQFNNYQTDIPSIAGGTSPEYLTARIARDRPDILERMKAGEYKSVRSAAIDAGIVDPDKTKRYSLPTDPAAAARYLLARVDAGWVATFVEELVKAV
jgi:hypothetical protein